MWIISSSFQALPNNTPSTPKPDFLERICKGNFIYFATVLYGHTASLSSLRVDSAAGTLPLLLERLAKTSTHHLELSAHSKPVDLS